MMVARESLGAFRKRFSDEEACLRYLMTQRWSGHPVCPKCKGAKGTLLVERRAWACSGTRCGHHLSVLKGTIFAGTKKPLTAWFEAIWWFYRQERPLTVSRLQAVANLKSYQTASVWLRKLRVAAAQLFLREASATGSRAALLQPALSPQRPAKSTLPLVPQVLAQVGSRFPKETTRNPRWKACMAIWSEVHCRARETTFAERALELGFRLVVQPSCRLPAFLLALAVRPALAGGLASIGGGS